MIQKRTVSFGELGGCLESRGLNDAANKSQRAARRDMAWVRMALCVMTDFKVDGASRSRNMEGRWPGTDVS